MLAIDELEIAGPGTSPDSGDGNSSFRRILVPVHRPGESSPALAVAARICGTTGGMLRLVHVRTCDPPLPISGRFYRETVSEAAAVLERALLAAWASGGPPASTVVVDARHGDAAVAIASQAAAWPADPLIALTRRPRPLITRLVLGSVADQAVRKASCPVLAIPARQESEAPQQLDLRGCRGILIEAAWQHEVPAATPELGPGQAPAQDSVTDLAGKARPGRNAGRTRWTRCSHRIGRGLVPRGLRLMPPGCSPVTGSTPPGTDPTR
jgi:nucleotide-binding universal stress UspA family protein